MAGWKEGRERCARGSGLRRMVPRVHGDGTEKARKPRGSRARGDRLEAGLEAGLGGSLRALGSLETGLEGQGLQTGVWASLCKRRVPGTSSYAHGAKWFQELCT